MMKIAIGKFIVLSFLSAFTFNAYAEWKCYAVDQRGHYWMSTGMTQERAAIVALNFCNAYSPYANSCHQSKCFEKEV
jgi:hypothetical protein